MHVCGIFNDIVNKRRLW